MSVAIFPVHGIPEIAPGDDLVAALLGGLRASGLLLHDRDVVVVTHKVVSKAEGRIEAAPDDDAYRKLAERESRSVLRRRGDLIISQTEHGFICANAGVDLSNAPGEDIAVLLPVDPDASARRLYEAERLRHRLPAVVLLVLEASEVQGGRGDRAVSE